MRKRLLIMMTALAVTAATVPGTAMVTYAENMDAVENAGEMPTEEAKKKAEEEAKKQAEAKRVAEEEAKKQAEAERAAEEEASRQAEEARRAAEEEAARQAEEARRAAEEEAERQAEEARRAAEEEAERQAEEARRAAEEEAARQAEEARRAAEEEAERQNENYNISYVWEQDTEESSYVCTAVAANTEEEIVMTESVKAVLEEISASCEEPGQSIYTAVFENPIFETQVKKEEIPALGHIFGEEPTYVWNDTDNTCTATRVCERDGYTETETAVANSEVILEPTCTETGIRRYIAEFTNPAFSAQLKKEEIPALGHRFAEPTYSWNDTDNTCTATRVCEEDGYTETETVAASSEVILEPTSTETGIRRYIAEFTNPAFSAQLKKVEIPATGKKPADNKKDNNKTDNKANNNKTENKTNNKTDNKTVAKKTTAQNQNTTQNQNTAQSTKKTAPVKTGDTTQPIIPIAVGTGALAAIAAIILKLRRNRG